MRFKEFLKELAKPGSELNYQHAHFQDEPVFAVQHMQYDTLPKHMKKKCADAMAQHNGEWNGKDAYHFKSKKDADAAQKTMNSLISSFQD